MTIGNLIELSKAKAPDSHGARLIHAQLVNSGEPKPVVEALEAYIGTASEVERAKEILKAARDQAKEAWGEVQARAAKKIKGDATDV